ncbi:MAG: LptF/LptG family permease [Chlamydiia bacterium]|nr:LptF/LptG family permease [Chlamydiia bacterium]
MKIWQRHFLKEFFQILFLFLFGIYGLFVLIDYSSRSGTYFLSQLSYKELGQFYFSVFFERLDILLPFALVVATVKTLTSLNLRNELVSLLSSGVPLKTLMRPFVAVGLLCTLLLYLNSEIFFPLAYRQINFLKQMHQDEKPKNDNGKNIYALEVLDQGKLLYHAYDTYHEAFSDVIWIREPGDIYRMRYLNPHGTIPVGTGVDHFERPEGGRMRLSATFEKLNLPQMKFNPISLRLSTMIPREEPLSSLAKEVPNAFRRSKDDASSAILTSFFHRLFMPWLCLLAVIGPAPWCLRFTRELSVFMIYLVSIAALVSFYLVMNAAQILGESQVFPPLLAIGVPFGLYAAYFGVKYWRM